MALATYLFQIKCSEDFARCSNFIYKYYSNQSVLENETKNVFFRVQEGMDNIDARERCADVAKKREIYKSIGRSILSFNDNFDVVFVMKIDAKDMDEIVLYQNMILILKYYSDKPVFCLCCGSQKHYFKLSQYLYCATSENGLSDKIFFLEDNKFPVKKLQQNNIQYSTSFFPLLYVTPQNMERLRSNSSVQIGTECIRRIKEPRKEKACMQPMWSALDGAVKLFEECQQDFSDNLIEQMDNILSKMDTLTFILMAYSLKNMKEWHTEIGEKELMNYARVMQQYANACFQLMENILYHSDSKWGILSIRIHRPDEESESSYLKNYYGKAFAEGSCFEIVIRDYSGETLTGNIAQHFLENLTTESTATFKGLTPRNLFCSSLGVADSFENEWKEFYRDPIHIGRHFGLRVFQQIVSENEGSFIAESFQGYNIREGEQYCFHSQPNGRYDYVMPGTGYSVLLPLKKIQHQLIVKDVTQEYGNWLCRKSSLLFELEPYEFSMDFSDIIFDSQKEKVNSIKKMALAILGQNLKRTTVLTISAAWMTSSKAELCLKSIIIASYEMQERVSFVIYDCSHEFVESCTTLMRELFATDLENMFAGCGFQIILITTEYHELVYVPGNLHKTDGINLYISRMKGIKCETLFDADNQPNDLNEFASFYIPVDILVKKGTVSLFQEYVQKILLNDIQKENFGCKIMHTHMRLGSTIHINHFFEAELLFGIKYFRTRFAFLILRDLIGNLTFGDKIMLYGYAAYSEPLLVELRNAIRMLDSTIDVDYIILEREEERRGFSHKDRIRYSRPAHKVEEDRKYVIIVPVNSTLKTHQRMIHLLEEQEKGFKRNTVMEAYALILVGTQEDNVYWSRKGEDRLACKISDAFPNPKYFVDVVTSYNEPMKCNMCFPKNVLLEEPLIEVNAASTIPNQSFGIIRNEILAIKNLTKIQEDIIMEEEKLSALKGCLIYGHYERNDEHYLYYVCTEKLAVFAEQEIRESLRNWRKYFKVGPKEYHVLVTPMHFTNCGFVEMVNDEVFSGMASVLRIDFKKDFRSNTYAKYSYIRQYIRQLGEIEGVSVKFHFVDDSIITGKTFYRAKSLLRSIVNECIRDAECHVHIEIFDRLFVLVDRNSKESRLQYLLQDGRELRNIDNYYYTFLSLNISSLRIYGDSCVICNLYREAKLLKKTSSTKAMISYWKNSEKKFEIRPIENAIEMKEQPGEMGEIYNGRVYRRMITTHLVKEILHRYHYNNQKTNAIIILLNLFRQDYMYRKEEKKNEDEAFEYFVSYLKVTSRPFLVFDKAVKEAIFDILLNIAMTIIDSRYSKNEKKEEWKSSQIKAVWNLIQKDILECLNDKQKRDLLLMCMKQLTELKSNFIIRRENIRLLNNFIHRENVYQKSDIDDFWSRYSILVKRLTGTGSDTSKSYWLDYLIINKREYESDMDSVPLAWPKEVQEQIVLENTRNFRDGIEKIYKRFFHYDEAKPIFAEYEECLMSKRSAYHNLCAVRCLNEKKAGLITLEKGQCYDHIMSLLPYDGACSPNKVKACFDQSGNTEDFFDSCLNQIDVNDCRTLKQRFANVYERMKTMLTDSGYQYESFQGFCTCMGWFLSKEYTEEGIRQLSACLGIRKLCDEMEKGSDIQMQKSMEKFTRYACELLRQRRVNLLVECDNSSEYYKEEIEKKYKEAEKRVGASENLSSQIWKRKRCYGILQDTMPGSGEYNEQLHDDYCSEMYDIMNDDDVISSLGDAGYYYNGGIFIWRLGYKSRFPLYVYAQLDENSQDIFRIRSLMMYTSELEKSIFNSKILGAQHDLMLAQRSLLLYNKGNSITHTSEQNLYEKFGKSIKNYLSNDEEETKQTGLNNATDTMILLADINVSNIYRKSLHREFYEYSDPFNDYYWENQWNMLRKDNVVLHDTVHKDGEETKIRLHQGNEYMKERAVEAQEKIMSNDEMAYELFSLLLALVLNAGQKNRGILNSDGMVDVYISKTGDGSLRIANRTSESPDCLPHITRCMETEPGTKESGITLWSMNCHLKRVKVGYIAWLLGCTEDAKRMKEVSGKIADIIGEKFEIRPEIEELEGKRWFSCKIPIFCEKYET